MKNRRILAIALACAMSLALLTACGGSGGSSSGSQSSGDQSDTSTSISDGSQPDSSAPDSSSPDVSAPDGSQEVVLQPVELPKPEATLSLSKSDFTLKKAGASWQLKAVAEPAGGRQSWSSSDEKVATVSDNGTVTAVAPGTVTITVTDESTGLTASCVVRCSWTEDSGSSSSGSSSSGGSSSTPASKVDLSAFAEKVMGGYEFGFLELADQDIMDNMYPGLSGVSTEQCLVYITMMSMNNGEFGLVQVKDSKDVDTVKAIFQARIDYMSGADGGQPGAWYPGPTEQWANNSTVVSNGNYIMMVVHENYADIVKAFNDLF